MKEVAAMIEIQRSSDGFIAKVSSPEWKPGLLGPKVWRSGPSMEPVALVRALERIGLHQRDAWDELLDVAPELNKP
jgi:hypothetical protein